MGSLSSPGRVEGTGFLWPASESGGVGYRLGDLESRCMILDEGLMGFFLRRYMGCSPVLLRGRLGLWRKNAPCLQD